MMNGVIAALRASSPALPTFAGLQCLDVLTTLIFLSKGIGGGNALVAWMLPHVQTPLICLALAKAPAMTIGLWCRRGASEQRGSTDGPLQYDQFLGILTFLMSRLRLRFQAAYLLRPTLAVLIGAIPGCASILYTVTPTGLTEVIEARALNNEGQVTGQITANKAGVWSDGNITDLGTPDNVFNWAAAINDSGQVAGYGTTTSGTDEAFLYSGGTMSYLGTFGGRLSQAFGINDAGQVVGEATLASGLSHAFLYNDDEMMDLGTLGGSYSEAMDINDSGQVVGWADKDTEASRAFLYYNGVMTDLGTLGGYDSAATAINNSGEIVGASRVAPFGFSHAFLYQNGAMTDLGTLGGTFSGAKGINDSGQVVGAAYTASGAAHAFLYSNGTMTDLNSVIDPSLNLTLLEATAINNSGQILAWTGSNAYYLLTPVSATPEPADWLLCSGGLLAFAALRQRMRNQRMPKTA